MSLPEMSHHRLEAPSAWIVRFAPLLAADALVLDVACGYGRHARFFAARGARVVAVDRDAQALATLSGVEGIAPLLADLEQAAWPIQDQRFDAIVVTNYLHRPSLPRLLATLAPGGVLLYETFAVGNAAYGKPSNPDFLLAPGELLDLVRGALTVVAFEQGAVAGARPAVVQRLAAIAPDYAWPPRLPS